MTAAVRSVRVEPLSARVELANVLRAGMAIVIAMWMFVAAAGSARDAASGKHLLPFQALVADRPTTEQRMFRELQEGLLEAESRRASAGTWPDVATLAAEGIPPFAIDPTAKGSRYAWTVIQRGTYINYLGLPSQPGAPAWLLLVIEPERGAPPDPAREDEEHNKLLDGTMLHVSTWVHPDGARIANTIVRIPQAEGWTQIYAVGPSPAATASASSRGSAARSAGCTACRTASSCARRPSRA